MLKLIIYSFIFALWANASIAQKAPVSLQQKIAGWQAANGITGAGIGISICDTQTGEELVKSAPQLSLVPASILKVVTTATALEVFGPDFRFATTLSGYGNIRNDTLFGDLRIVGGGDPTLGSFYFPDDNHFLETWAAAIQNQNIKVVRGNLILDASIYEPQTIPDTWVWEDIGNYYGAGASGISVFDNLFDIHLSSGKEEGKLTKVERVTPEISHLEIENEVVASVLNSDQAFVFGSPLDHRRVIRGTIPMNRSDFTVKASVPYPAELLAGEFRRALSVKSIEISGETRFERVKDDRQQPVILSVKQSPPLRDIIRVTNHESVNLFAEHLLKHLSLQNSKQGNTKEGCKFVVQFWKAKGLDVTGFFMNDGSGLSRFNAITASQMCGILNYMKTKSQYPADFYSSLPTAGKGTLTAFSAGNFPQDCLRAKSGSMTRVRCYAGYLTTESGRQLSFAVMLNNFSCTMAEATRKIEELLMELRKL